jgi:hypothetical protein
VPNASMRRPARSFTRCACSPNPDSPAAATTYAEAPLQDRAQGARAGQLSDGSLGRRRSPKFSGTPTRAWKPLLRRDPGVPEAPDLPQEPFLRVRARAGPTPRARALLDDLRLWCEELITRGWVSASTRSRPTPHGTAYSPLSRTSTPRRRRNRGRRRPVTARNRNCSLTKFFTLRVYLGRFEKR